MKDLKDKLVEIKTGMSEDSMAGLAERVGTVLIETGELMTGNANAIASFKISPLAKRWASAPKGKELHTFIGSLEGIRDTERLVVALKKCKNWLQL